MLIYNNPKTCILHLDWIVFDDLLFPHIATSVVYELVIEGSGLASRAII